MADDETTTTSDESATDSQDDGQAQLGEAGQKALAEERRKAREAEKARKAAEAKLTAATAELEKSRKAAMTETELAMTKAREEGMAEGRQTTLREVGGELVDAHLTAALTGRMDDGQRTALLDGLDRTRFLTDDGKVDVKALTAWVDRVAPPPTGRPPLPDRSQGRGSDKKLTGMDQIIRQAAGVTGR